MGDEKRDQDNESERIVERVRRETEPASSHAHSVRRARRHFSARDADQHDRVELWGTRIGRGLALVVALALIVWLVNFLTR